ncbi:5'-nucleotidase [Pseudodesulfovibrio profundus]|uniref:5'-nucleotidase n=1 Tax=Pseudodesulfovibrio profundus TaxID=57320 RepID=A0A2C8FC18_9BACT|nr:5'-nucleotidase [Pseudodesulfovibrio profundus]SOB59985.1 5'-nucleotidase [Pseudodesulfovibrio profundus]
MNPILLDDVWQRKGISVIWDNHVLAKLVKDSRAISLREFFSYYEKSWPDDDMPFINNDLLLVAGLDAALDTLEAQNAEEWVTQEVYKRIYDFQNWAEGQYALVFWMSKQDRWREHLENNRYTWLCDGKDRGKEIELGSGIWNGAQLSVRRIESDGRWIGLFLDRIS